MKAHISDLHRVGGGFSVQFHTSARGIEAEWTPRLPTERDLRCKVDMTRYRQALAQFVAAAMSTLEGPIVGGVQ
jgi:hypothetical protein